MHHRKKSISQIIGLIILSLWVYKAEAQNKTYYPDGRLKTETATLSKSNDTVKWTFYYDSDDLDYLANVTFLYRDSLYHAERETYSSFEYFLHIGMKKNGLKHGLWREYAHTGELFCEGSYFNNSKIGNWIYYYLNGIIGKGELDINDYRKGYWEFYNKKGILVEKGNYSEGYRDGKWVFYDSIGNYKKRTIYKKDKEIGTDSIYRKNGSLEKINVYDNEGELLNISYYDKNGVKNTHARTSREIVRYFLMTAP